MEKRTVVIVGDSLFAESLSQMLAQSDGVDVAACVPTLDAALSAIVKYQPDAVIVAVTDRAAAHDYSQLIAAEPDLPIVYADLNADSVQIITSQRISARPADLITALAELPKRY
jgi:DNA-binding NarL/FixJ family response regulator